MAAQAGATDAATRGGRRRARTREAILDAAEEVFRRTGHDGARIEDVADSADVSVGSIYVHFGGKHGLYLAAVERALDLFADYMARCDDPSFGPLERVLAGGDAYLRFHLDHPGAFQFLAFPAPSGGRGGNPEDEAAEHRIQERVGALLTWFAGLVDAAIAAGEARPVDTVRLTHYLWGAWNGVINLSRQPEGLRLGDDEIAETLELARWLLREGLGARSLRDAHGEVGDRVRLPRIP